MLQNIFLIFYILYFYLLSADMNETGTWLNIMG